MKELFPAKQVMGFIFSLALTFIAIGVYFFDLSFAAGLMVLIVTAFIQALLQLIVFMHAGETKDKWSIYSTVFFMIFIALVTIFCTLFLFMWDM
ncbi:cytochrome aa3 quinol oxidase subunit IV [Bacillus sp. REN16]|uniref:cytochrome aa3 quinol oxidase subunit IV n=1 Tax=Bacillus sp. REN16 TaxID=2887296 RepID=UPI001E5C4FE6|nr:cytochrome aa3 quinol oxidase subunit IV [Bacillus sp. REN16]MCC3358479.1 cytochrome aa3 quinol oxidase subunit IV [Bacillus sp. REN16]